MVKMRTLITEGYNAYITFPATEWETFINLKDNGVSDIYIDGPLGFQTDLLQKKKVSTLIRVSPSRSLNAELSKSNNATSFFIRPEDLNLYESTIDIIDFNEPNQEKEDTLFKIYKRGTFDFDLK